MTDKRTQEHANESNMQKDPEAWVTGDEPMTGAQRSYLKTLSEEAREPFDDTLTKAQASQRIDELQARTGRGAHAGAAPGRSGTGEPGAQGTGTGTDTRTSTGAEPTDNPLESIGRAIGETVLGAEPDEPENGMGTRST